MNYYVLQNDEIALFDTDKSRLQTTLKFKPELADAKIHQTTKEIVELDGKFVFADEHQEEIDALKELEEQQQTYEANQQAINGLKDDLLTATLMGDEEWIADLKAEYAELTEETE